MLPAVHTMATRLGYPLQFQSAVPIEIVTWGILIILADQPIYMLYLGRRFWPAPAVKHYLAREENRLEKLKLLAASQPSKADKQFKRLHRVWLEANIRLNSFPLSEDTSEIETGEKIVRLPTRLGNLVLAYESYTVSRYGLDGPFYWRRIWLRLDKDLRSEIDQIQAIADCSIYLSFVSALAGLVATIYLVLTAGLGLVATPLDIEYVPSRLSLLVLIVVLPSLSYAIYRLGIFAHEQFAETFKAVFDQFHGELGFLDEVSEYVLQKGGQNTSSLREKRIVAWRYLRWYLIRVPGTTVNVPPGKISRICDYNRSG
jgi:hypothetical protein